MTKKVQPQVSHLATDRIPVGVVIATVRCSGAAQDPVEALDFMRELLVLWGISVIGFVGAPSLKRFRGSAFARGFARSAGREGRSHAR